MSRERDGNVCFSVCVCDLPVHEAIGEKSNLAENHNLTSLYISRWFPWRPGRQMLCEAMGCGTATFDTKHLFESTPVLCLCPPGNVLIGEIKSVQRGLVKTSTECLLFL